MINKKFVVAIVLAVGLFMSIGIVLGQEDKDKLIQEMKEKELEGKEPV